MLGWSIYNYLYFKDNSLKYVIIIFHDQNSDLRNNFFHLRNSFTFILFVFFAVWKTFCFCPLWKQNQLILVIINTFYRYSIIMKICMKFSFMLFYVIFWSLWSDLPLTIHSLTLIRIRGPKKNPYQFNLCNFYKRRN